MVSFQVGYWPYDIKKLSDLTTKGQMWSIKVKVIRVWDSDSKQKISESNQQCNW